MENESRYGATMLEMTAAGVLPESRILHQTRGDRLRGEWRAAVGGRARDYRYEACCVRVEGGRALGAEPRPYPSAVGTGTDGAATGALQLWDQRVWWDETGLYLEARWRPDTGEQPYSLHGIGRDGRLPADQRVREAIAMLGAVQGIQSAPGHVPSDVAAGSPYARLIDPIMEQTRKGKTVDQIAVYLSLNPKIVRDYVGRYDELHPDEKR